MSGARVFLTIAGAVALAACAATAGAGAATGAPPRHEVFVASADRAPARTPLGPRSLGLEIDAAALGALARDGAGSLPLPLRDGRVLDLVIERFDLLTPGAVVTTTDDDGSHAFAPEVTLFRGAVSGIAGSRVVLSASALGVLGMIEAEGERYEIAPLAGDGRSTHVVADTRDLTPPERRFDCGTEDPDGSPRGRLSPEAVRPGTFTPTAGGRLRCELAVDCDWEYFSAQWSWSTINATAYALTLLAITSDIYETDIDVELRVSYFNLWTTPDDPYTGTTIFTQQPEFEGWWAQNRPFVSRHLAHLISGRNLGGGIARLGVVGHPTLGYALSQVNSIFSYPTSTATWDVFVLAHEIGHNFNSPHTHSCFWQQNGYTPAGTLLDSCFTAEGACYTGPLGILPPNRGTLMSYCHGVAGVAGGIRLEFHAASKNEMRNHAEARLPDAPFDAGVSLAGVANDAVVSLSWNVSPEPGVLHYDVYRSPLPLALVPELLGSTTGTSFVDTAGLGDYRYRVRAVRAADHSGYSNEVFVEVCPLAGLGFVGPGVSTTTPVVADFNADGIPDVAVANGVSSGIAYVFMGVGGGALSPPTSYPVGRYPVEMITGDFDEDGITDLLAVSRLFAGGLTFLFGNGTDGVGDGTFADSLVVPVGQEPATVVAEDFNEDGIVDLAVGGNGNSRVTIMIGQGTDGTGNGTFVSDPNTYLVATRPVAMVSGDFNDDGIHDLAVLGSTNGQISILLGLGQGGQGNGTFAAPVSYPTGGGTAALVRGDFDADGITDLATIQRDAEGSMALLFGQGSAGVGDGTFGLPVELPTGTLATDLAVGDLDGDGVADLALTNGDASAFTLLLGRSVGGIPNGMFGSPVPLAVGDSPSALALADLDSDGKPDVVMTHFANPQTVGVLSATCAARVSTALTLLSPNGGEDWGIVSEETISWSKGPGVVAVHLDIDRGDGRWERIASNQTGTSFVWTVSGPTTDSATVRVRVYDAVVAGRMDESDAEFQIGPDIRLAVEPGAAGTLAIDRVYPNPGRGSLWVGFSLPAAGPATLEVMDIAGRRVRSIDVGGHGRGSHVARVDGGAPLRSGVYLVRLSQAGVRVTAKAAVLR